MARKVARKVARWQIKSLKSWHCLHRPVRPQAGFIGVTGGFHGSQKHGVESLVQSIGVHGEAKWAVRGLWRSFAVD